MLNFFLGNHYRRYIEGGKDQKKEKKKKTGWVRSSLDLGNKILFLVVVGYFGWCFSNKGEGMDPTSLKLVCQNCVHQPVTLQEAPAFKLL